MHIKRAGAGIMGAALAASMASACGGDQIEQPATEVQSAVVGVDTYLYFRCNATGWNPIAANRLQPTGAAGTFAVSYDVTQPWMVAPGGDDCALTETNQLDGWGTTQTYYAATASVRVPGTGTLTAGGRDQRTFRVSYPVQGRFQLTLNWTQRTFSIAQAGAPFSPIAFFGDAANYQPLTATRWSVASDGGDARYFLNTSNYAAAGGGRLGEYTLVRDRRYGDFLFNLTARTNESITSNPAADFAVVYGFQDASNYSFMSFSARATETQVFRVTAGQRAVVATANRAGIIDAGYHAIQVWRHGVWIRVAVDGQVILSANDNTAGAVVGQVGVGSLDDSAFFDDIEVASYVDVATPHYRISIPSNTVAYQDSVSSILENAYQLYLDNTGWDINARMGHAFYDYLYRPSGWIWIDDANGCCELCGGLTVPGGPSAVLSESIPESRLPASERNGFVAISLHELGNGWFLPGPAPDQWVEWLRSESHSGFLRAEGELDMGYCVDANGEHAGHYADYLATSLDDRRLHGAAVEPLLVSLRERYGWAPFRSLYNANLAGQLDYLGGLTSDQRDNEMVLFLSRQVNESLIAFFERELGVTTMQYVRTALAGLPVSNLTVLSTLPCHAPALRATPRALTLTATAANRTPSAVLYAEAPSAWTARLATTGTPLSITRNGTTPATTITVSANAAGLASGAVVTTQLVLEGSGLAGSPLRIPVTLQVQ